MPRKTISSEPSEQAPVYVPTVSRKIFLALLIILLIATGVWLGVSFNAPQRESLSPYSAVYLASGDIYFGKFSRYPEPHMTDAWHLDRGVDKNNNPQVGLSSMKNVLWAPGDTMYFGKNQIVFWTRVRTDSPLIKYLSGQEVPPPAPTPQEPPQSTSTP